MWPDCNKCCSGTANAFAQIFLTCSFTCLLFLTKMTDYL